MGALNIRTTCSADVVTACREDRILRAWIRPEWLDPRALHEQALARPMVRWAVADDFFQEDKLDSLVVDHARLDYCPDDTGLPYHSFAVRVDSLSSVGIATSSRRVNSREEVRHFRILVIPSRRRLGIGTRLLAELTTMDANKERTIFQSLCPSNWTSGFGFLTRWNFLVAESELQLKLEQLPKLSGSPYRDLTIARSENPITYAREVASLHNRAYQLDVSFVAYSTEAMEYNLEGAALWIARRDQEIIGFVHAEENGSCTWIESVVVDPQYQHAGVGTWCVSTVVTELLAEPGRRVELQVSDHNPSAMRIYEKLGFQRITESYRFRIPLTELTRDMAAKI